MIVHMLAVLIALELLVLGALLVWHDPWPPERPLCEQHPDECAEVDLDWRLMGYPG